MESIDKSDAGCDKESQLETPYGDWDCDTFVASMKEEEDSISLSSSSSDLEPESVVLYEGTSVTAGVKELSECIQLKENYLDQYGGSYDELLKKFIQNEEELRVSNCKLEHSEEEIIKLKIQIEQCEGQLDDVQKELKLKECDLEYEKGQVLEMQKQKAELRDCCDKITKFEEMLEVVANEHLKISSNEIARLTKELESKLYETQELQGQLKVADERVAKLECEFDSGRKQIQDLEDKIKWYKANETSLDLEMQKLKVEMVNMQEEFSLEKDKLYFNIQSLSKTNEDLTSRSNEYESKLRQCAIANLKQEELHAAIQMALKVEISSLKEEVGQRKYDVEAVKEEFEMYKQKFDMLLTEKEEADAKINILKAELINNLCLSQELMVKVDELERDVNRQKCMISNLKMEKKEAIQELCLSVEDYKTKYQQLLQDRRCMFF